MNVDEGSGQNLDLYLHWVCQLGFLLEAFACMQLVLKPVCAGPFIFPFIVLTNHITLFYSKFPKISDTFLFLFSNKMFVIPNQGWILQLLVRIANREDPD